jgi:hypothetical protein
MFRCKYCAILCKYNKIDIRDTICCEKYNMRIEKKHKTLILFILGNLLILHIQMKSKIF